MKQLNVNIDLIRCHILSVTQRSTNVGYFWRGAAADLRQLLTLTHTVPYLLRKSVFAAVINNLEVSPSMQSFKSSQLAAWLSPLHSQSVMRATCRLPITVLCSDHTSLLAFSVPNFCCRKIYCSCILSSWCFIQVMNRRLHHFLSSFLLQHKK